MILTLWMLPRRGWGLRISDHDEFPPRAGVAFGWTELYLDLKTVML